MTCLRIIDFIGVFHFIFNFNQFHFIFFYWCKFQDLIELSHFVPSEEMAAANKCCLSLYPQNVILNVVDSTEGFQSMIADIMNQVEIAVDLEGHSEYSFRGRFKLIYCSFTFT